MDLSSAEAILSYWFAAADTAPTVATMEDCAARWFRRSDATDAYVRDTFGAEMAAAARGERDAWVESPRGLLALLILLDQFPRNVHRGSAEAFAQDGRARAVVRHGLERGFDRHYNAAHSVVFYLPLVHTEDLAVQREAFERIRRLRESHEALAPVLDLVVGATRKHLEIIERFGRFPHRNAALGRATTPEEAEFLSQPGSSF